MVEIQRRGLMACSYSLFLFPDSDHPRRVPGPVLHDAPTNPRQEKFVCHGSIVVTPIGVYAMLKNG